MHLNDIDSYGHWLFGASNKYTPDEIWWNNALPDYVLVGKYRYASENKGSGFLSMNYIYPIWETRWNIGASLPNHNTRQMHSRGIMVSGIMHLLAVMLTLGFGAVVQVSV